MGGAARSPVDLSQSSGHVPYLRSLGISDETGTPKRPPISTTIRFSLMTEILEKDWKRFKQLHLELLERHCKQTLDLLIEAIHSGESTPHAAVLEVGKIVQKRDREMSELFDDYRRSTAILQLIVMRRQGMLLDSDVVGFSTELTTKLLSANDL